MIRKAFLMKLRAGCQEEYVDRHNPIWPDLEAVLKKHGVHNYSIFLDRSTNNLFAYVEIESEELWTSIAATGECRRWWSHMKELMLTNADDSPVTVLLDEVFHLQ